MTKTSMATRREVAEKHKGKYLKSSKEEKGVILDAVCLATGLSRDRAARILSDAAPPPKRRERRGRKERYGSDVIVALAWIWQLMDCPSSRRLVAGMANMIEALKRHGELTFRNDTIALLLQISATTADRLLKRARKDFGFRGISTTKPGTLLKNQIPIRMGDQWDENMPGFVEIDLVAHCGSTTAGEYVNTLDITDINTGWTETQSVVTKAQHHVFQALMDIKARLPFKLRGVDSDNGSEFINNQLLRYCNENNICFTRSRSYKKNDNCHVEQKNWHAVRHQMGYYRYEGRKTVEFMNRFYEVFRLYYNFFLPQTKLIEKFRDGARIRKLYEKPKTPYQRILQSDVISEEEKTALIEIFVTLNPVQLKKEMVELQKQLLALSIPNV